MAGGTGGHIFPAMAVAEQLQKTQAEIHWLGTPMGMETTLVDRKNISLHLIDMKGFRGKGLSRKLVMPFLLLKSIWQSIGVIKKINPAVVVGFGGYVTLPGGLAARLLGKKLVIHEQNSISGSANKLLSKVTRHVLEAFPGSLPQAELVGNPVRKELTALFATRGTNNDRKQKRLLIMGGSLGAEAINQVLPDTINSLSNTFELEVWHQTGKGKQKQTQEKYQQLNLTVRVEEFIDSVDEAYQWADIIICRAGALTVSEIAVVGLPAIFIPYPYAIDNHQFNNAQLLVNHNAAELIEQKDLTAEKLSETIKFLFGDSKSLNNMSVNLRKLAKPEAANQVSSICEKLCREVNSRAA
jgi:UDP-N-acetylglucosamine--N-acetylmuramyl-(pentapeptide) pyrophosphoryl-undecaprenol N-acetylglucosamine transferase